MPPQTHAPRFDSARVYTVEIIRLDTHEETHPGLNATDEARTAQLSRELSEADEPGTLPGFHRVLKVEEKPLSDRLLTGAGSAEGVSAAIAALIKRALPGRGKRRRRQRRSP